MAGTAVFEEEKRISSLLEEQLNIERFYILGSAAEHEITGETVDESFLEEYMETIRRQDDGRVIMKLPKVKNFHGKLSDNRQLCNGRSKSQIKMTIQEPEKAEEYRKIFESWKETGVITPISEEALKDKVSVELPHHAVVKESSESTKVRVVIDGSAHQAGEHPVNSYLQAGPNILPKIQHIILQWRSHDVFIVADVEKAFLQIALDEEDVGFLIVRWHEKATNGGWIKQFYTFTRLIWGLICSPMMLNVALVYLLREYVKKYPQLKEYYDDMR
jgi:hypothetical protein